MSQINTLIKPTHKCNLRCKYCFHEKYGYESEILEMNLLKKYVELLSKKYQYINIIWHGGEPLMAPLDYYEEIYDFCDSLDSSFIYSIQTNGTLLNEKNVDFFKNHNTSIGLSFDGLANDKTRSNTSQIIKNISLLQEKGFNPGAIMVVNQNNVLNLIDEYEYFKQLDLSMKINPMFNDGAAQKNNCFTLDANVYIEEFIKLFKYWMVDLNCNINVSRFEDFIKLILHERSGVCTFNSCLGKWLCLDSNGKVYPCDRLCVDDYCLGDVKKIKNIDELFENNIFINLLKDSIARRDECQSNCEYYKNCYGGCNANRFLNMINNENTSCYIQKGILKELKSLLNENSLSNYDNLNSNFVKVLTNK